MKAKFDRNDTYVKDGAEYSFNFCTSIGAIDKMSFVNDVVELIADGTYEYVIRDLMFDYMLINTFTDIDCGEINECENGKIAISMIEDLVCNTTIVDIVKANIVPGLLEELNKAIDYNIEYRTGIRIDHISDAVASLINQITMKIESYDVDAFSDVAKLFSGLDASGFNVDSLLSAYANSDVFKKQQELAIDASNERAKRLKLIAEKANKA